MNREFLHALLAEHTPSGYEKNAHDVIINHLKAENVPYKFEFADKAHNICVSLEPNAYFGGPKIMISGHIDEIGLQVQYIVLTNNPYVQQTSLLVLDSSSSNLLLNSFQVHS